MNQSANPYEYRFGENVLLPGEQRLLISGKPAIVGPRAFDLLVALAQRAGKLVSKSELLDLVWPDVVVEENNLQVQISALRKLLGPQAIATTPGRGYRFTLAVETGGGDPIPKPTPAGESAEPASEPVVRTSLFGREDDLVALQSMLSLHPLITIVGPGGIGKTRLAAAVADACRRQLTRAVGWVDLAPLSDPTLIPGTIAAALGLPLDEKGDPLDALVTVLKTRSALIVLDNCEHMIDTMATIARGLIRGTENLRLLATSRSALRVDDEQIYRLGPLAVPAVKTAAREAHAHGAIALFVARARATDRRFEMNDKNVAVVIDVCAKLDGMPLAIELAAARLPLLGLNGVQAGLAERFRLLTVGSRNAPARQQTMQATFDWSYGLLGELEKIVLRRLGVFAGGFTLEAVRAVIPSEPWSEWDVVDALGGLVDKSLVLVDCNDPPRYHLLETGRAYALDKLVQAGETGDLQRLHAAYFRGFFDHAHDVRWTIPDAQWHAQFDPELDNLRAALKWALDSESDVITGVALAGASWLVWEPRDYHFLSEGRRYVQSAVARLTPSTPKPLEARLWLASAVLAPFSDVGSRLASLERAVRLCRGGGSEQFLCFALLQYAHHLNINGRFETAEQMLCEAQSLLKRTPLARLQGLHDMVAGARQQLMGHPDNARSLFKSAIASLERSGAEDMALRSLNALGDATWALGDLDGAATVFREAVDRTRRSRFARRTAAAIVLANLTGVLIEQRALAEALPIARQALVYLREADRGWEVYGALSLRLALLGRYEDAARLEGFVNAVYEAGSLRRGPNEERLRERLFALLGEKFSETEVAQLLSEGAKLSEKEAYRIAL